MRYALLLIALVLSATFTKAQNFLISFAGTGASTTVSSVKVENLMSGAALTLSGTDILRLTGTTNINAYKKVKSSELTIYPNPSDGDAIIQIYPPIAGSAQIKVFNMSGNIVSQFQKDLNNSHQELRLTGISKGFYIIQVTGKTYNYSGKIISNGNKDGKIAIEEVPPIQIVEKEKPEIKLKNAMTTIDMAYSNGDRLKFTGISGIYSTVLTDIPVSDKTITFNFIPCTDADANNYPIVQIGNQIWMAENLKATKYSDGTSIPKISDNASWSQLTSDAYCWYNNDSSGYKSIYGALYNWYAVNTNKLCPLGWHVPSDDEWTTLTTYLGGDNVAGGKLKETGLTHWESPNTSADNLSGFTGLPGGYRWGAFDWIGTHGLWWSANEWDVSNAWYLNILHDNQNSYKAFISKFEGLSIRCIKDPPINQEAYPGLDGPLVDFISNGDTITCEKINGEYIFQGDIILTEEQLNGSKGAGYSFLGRTWPEGKVYYTINENLPDIYRITKAIAEFERYTPLRFYKRTDQLSYIEFVRPKEDQGTEFYALSSYLGMILGKQTIRVGDIASTGDVVHEIGHSIGLIHEHSRKDRDQYIKIHHENIIPGAEYEYQFRKINNSIAEGSLDFDSKMMYNWRAFSIYSNPTPEQATITKIDGTTWKSNTSDYLSEGDKRIINKLYNNNGIIFNPNLVYSYISDIEGNIYKTIKIGTQTWMAENLKTTKYNDGTVIPFVTDASAWTALSTPAYCWYNNDAASNKATYGALYNWFTVNTGKLCPTGWHVPSDSEWSVLTEYLGGSTIAGGKLKETGLVHWSSPNTEATNESGFTALPSGYRAYDALFSDFGSNISFWSSTEYDAFKASDYGLFTGSTYFTSGNDNKLWGLSVRCTKDNNLSGLMVAYSFNGSLSDISGNIRLGTPEGIAKYSPGPTGRDQAANFDGTWRIIVDKSTPSDFSLSGNWSLAFSVFPKTSTIWGNGFIQRFYRASCPYGYGMFIFDEAKNFASQNYTTINSYAITNLVSNSWNRVIIIHRSNQTGDIYINGVLAQSNVSMSISDFGTKKMSIGGNYINEGCYGASYANNVLIDDFSLFNLTLSSTQISNDNLANPVGFK